MLYKLELQFSLMINLNRISVIAATNLTDLQTTLLIFHLSLLFGRAKYTQMIIVDIPHSLHSFSNPVTIIQYFILYILMSRKHEITSLIDEITRNQKFVAQVQKCVEGISKASQQKQQLPTFAFEKASKYPWSVVQGSLPVEGQKMIEEITDLIGNLIDHNLHQILSRQFLNISNEILVIRDQMSHFTKQEQTKMARMKQDFANQIQTLKKKMIIQQNMNGSGSGGQFVRTRATGILNSSVSTAYQNKSQMRAEVQFLRKQVELIKREVNKDQIIHHINDKLVYLEDLKHEMIDFKIKIQSVKQKSEKHYNQLVAKMGENNNKEFIGNQVKRGVKSYFKIYLEEISYCKSSINKFEDSLAKLDKGLQQYVANQLKSLWVVVGNMKRRVQSIEQSTNLNNQSFMME